MDEVLANSLKRQLDIAKENNDDKLLRIAQTEAICAMVDCQRKTAERVKIIEAFVVKGKQRIEGAKMFAHFLYAIAGVAGGAGTMKIIEIFATK